MLIIFTYILNQCCRGDSIERCCGAVGERQADLDGGYLAAIKICKIGGVMCKIDEILEGMEKTHKAGTRYPIPYELATPEFFVKQKKQLEKLKNN